MQKYTTLAVPRHKPLRPLKFEPRTEADPYLCRKDPTKACTEDTFIRFWLRLRHYPELTRRDALVYCAIKASVNRKRGLTVNESVVIGRCIANRLAVNESAVSRSLTRLCGIGVIHHDIGGYDYDVPLIVLDRDFSKAQPEESGEKAECPLKYEAPKNGKPVSEGFIKIYDRIINYIELTEMDRLVYSAIRYYIEAGRNAIETKNTNESIASVILASERSVRESVKHLEALDVIYVRKLGKHRAISLRRDFAEPQPEEIAYFTEHPDVTVKTDPHTDYPYTDEDFEDMPF